MRRRASATARVSSKNPRMRSPSAAARGLAPPPTGGMTAVFDASSSAVPHCGQNWLAGGTVAPHDGQLADMARRPVGARGRRLLERAQRRGGAAAERPDEGPVVVVRDGARAVVELEVLQGRERAVPL